MMLIEQVVMADKALSRKVLVEIPRLLPKGISIRFLGPRNKASLLSESKPILVCRRECKDSEVPRITRKFFHALRMWDPFRAVLVKADETTIAILQKLEPHITYGNPHPQTVKDFLYMDGAVKVNNVPRWLKDDNVAEQALGQYNIFCMQDVVNEILNVGPHFNDVAKVIRPFLVESTSGKKKRRNEDRAAGNNEDRITSS
ncbi:hypothetical protein OROMI_020964 [Orobanche minor]